MRQDWIEFELLNGKGDKTYMSFRPENISAILFNDADSTQIAYDISLTNKDYFRVVGSYEQVKQKIMDAEKFDLGNVVVERFTKDEYELLLNAVGYCEAAYNDTKENIEFLKRIEPLAKIQNKLNEILKEME